MKKCIAIITARGGSKRIPRKNIKDFLGHPIIKYSIDAALNAGCFDEVMVSTDDDEIAAIALSLGARVPFFRSKELSDDHATTSEVILEVLRMYSSIGQEFEYVCCIYPTAPFVTSKKLKVAYQTLQEKDAETLVPIVRFSYPILRSLKMNNDGLVIMNWPEHINTRSQDLSPAYHDCGQFYFLQSSAFIRDGKLFSNKCVGLEMPESEVQDIDTEEDWKIAEIKFSFLTTKMKNIEL